MTITAHQCRAARGLFAMSRQELANASGVSQRTIAGFEDASDRTPTAANLAAIMLALRRLGVVLDGAGVGWSSPFTETQTTVVRTLAVRNGPRMLTAADLMRDAGCSRADLEDLAKLQVITGIDGYPTLTAIGLHIPALLRDYQSRQVARQAKYAPINFTVSIPDRTVFHAQTAAVFGIETDGTLALRYAGSVPDNERQDVTGGAQEAVRLERERDPRVVGRFV